MADNKLLKVAFLVNTDKHIAACGEFEVRCALLVCQRNQTATTARTLDKRFIEALIVNHWADGCLIVVHILVVSVLVDKQQRIFLAQFVRCSAINCFDNVVPAGKRNCRAIYECDGIVYTDNGEAREEILATADILLPGRHNVENYMTAIALTEGLVSLDTIREVATTFRGVAHRLEFVREREGVKFYNSSIDSSPSRTAAALGALPKAPIVICGGYDKKIPFDTLAKSLCEKAKAVVLTGATAEKILSELKNCPDYDEEKLPVVHKADFREATLAAAEMASEGDIVLLSPACASFDAFKDFAARGEYFKEIVNGL